MAFSAVCSLMSSCSLDEDNPAAGDATLDNFAAWYGLQTTCYTPPVSYTHLTLPTTPYV